MCSEAGTAGNHVLWEMAEEPDISRLEKMRLQGVKYYLPPHEGLMRGLQLPGDGLEGRTLAKEKKFQLYIEQNILTIELFNNELRCFMK